MILVWNAHSFPTTPFGNSQGVNKKTIRTDDILQYRQHRLQEMHDFRVQTTSKELSMLVFKIVPPCQEGENAIRLSFSW